MDTADSRKAGLGRAFAVEQCNCPAGYRGLSCEECAAGYKRTRGGLYLGTCEQCDCNGHSTDCDGATGICKSCQHNTEGDNCEMCAPGFYGDATKGLFDDCKPCPCPLTQASNRFSPTCRMDADGQVSCTACQLGYTGRKCERCAPGYSGNPLVPGGSCKPTRKDFTDDCECDARGAETKETCDVDSGQCVCKANVEGIKCNQCKKGSFGLDATNPLGCTECFCSGLTDKCEMANVFMKTLEPALQSNGASGFSLITRRLEDPITQGIVIDPIASEITYDQFVPVTKEKPQSLYWNLPSPFTGDQIASYGGVLKFSILYYAKQDIEDGEGYYDVDCEIFGAGTQLYHTFEEPPTAGQLSTFEIPLIESSFQLLDGSTPSHKTFMSVLSNIENILVRATYDTAMASSSLRYLSLDTSSPETTDEAQVTSVEICSCPEGYTGLSCQLCAPGYSRDASGRCTSCSCNGHSATCDIVSGKCLNCQHNTMGDRCERCMAGFYGDATHGGQDDCQQCPCPLTVKSNQFSSTCVLNMDGKPTCDKCQPGYTGRDCGQCATGYTGNPRIVGGKCTLMPIKIGSRPLVTAAPTRNVLAVGSIATFTCSATAGNRLTYSWSRADGLPLPKSRAIVGRDNSLTIRNLQSSDAGKYICKATNEYGSGMQEVELVIVGERALTVIVKEPKVQRVTVGSTIKFNCIGISQYAYTLAWTSVDGDPLSPRFIDDGKGGLIIRNISPDDAGRYKCTGSNFYTTADDFGELIIDGAEEGAPTVKVSPTSQEVREGQPAEFRCTATGEPRPRIQWVGGQGGRLPSNAVASDTHLRFASVKRGTHEGEYKCIASNLAGQAEAKGILVVIGE